MTPILLDTHAFLWAVSDDPALSLKGRQAYQGGDNLFLSMASIWEMAIKVSLGKLRLARPLQEFVNAETIRNRIRIQPVQVEHCHLVSSLPFHHRDPFDRMLAAQALVGGWSLLSADPAFGSYGVDRIW